MLLTANVKCILQNETFKGRGGRERDREFEQIPPSFLPLLVVVIIMALMWQSLERDGKGKNMQVQNLKSSSLERISKQFSILEMNFKEKQQGEQHGVTATISACHSGGLQFKSCLRRNFSWGFFIFRSFQSQVDIFIFQTHWRTDQLVNEKDEDTRAA